MFIQCSCARWVDYISKKENGTLCRPLPGVWVCDLELCSESEGTRVIGIHNSISVALLIWSKSTSSQNKVSLSLLIVKGDDRGDPALTKRICGFDSWLVLGPVIPKTFKFGVVPLCMVLTIKDGPQKITGRPGVSII